MTKTIQAKPRFLVTCVRNNDLRIIAYFSRECLCFCNGLVPYNISNLPSKRIIYFNIFYLKEDLYVYRYQSQFK